MTTLTGQQLGLQSTQNLVPSPNPGPEAPRFSTGGTFTNTTTVTTSTVNPAGSASVTDGTTADPAATYVGSNGGTPMFAIKNPNGVTPPNLNNPLAAPAIPATTNQGFDTKGKTSQGLIGNL
jgi:hypothetical protein